MIKEIPGLLTNTFFTIYTYVTSDDRFNELFDHYSNCIKLASDNVKNFEPLVDSIHKFNYERKELSLEIIFTHTLPPVPGAKNLFAKIDQYVDLRKQQEVSFLIVNSCNNYIANDKLGIALFGAFCSEISLKVIGFTQHNYSNYAELTNEINAAFDHINTVSSAIHHAIDADTLDAFTDSLMATLPVNSNTTIVNFSGEDSSSY